MTTTILLITSFDPAVPESAADGSENFKQATGEKPEYAEVA
jgi:hypothetical protein